MDKQKIIDNAKKIFEEGSITYFNSAQLFPEEVRDDVMILYSFVRTADDFVDCNPPKAGEFFAFKNLFQNSLTKENSRELVISSFIDLMDRKNIPQKAPLKFLKSMQLDLTKNSYKNLEELEDYMIGSAEVIGVMMAKIMNLSKNSEPFARQLGKSMQFINFIRDIDYDLKTLNRVYIPQDLIHKYQLQDLSESSARNSLKNFSSLIRDLIELYFEWQLEAEAGFKLIPPECLIPVKTASDMYKWTAQEIYADPFVIYKKRLKPTPEQVIETAQKIKNSISNLASIA